MAEDIGPHAALHRATQPHTYLKICSINICELNTPEKRTQLLYSLQKTKAHIALIQEADFRTDSIPKLHNKHFPTVYHASNKDTKSKGVSILIAKHCPIQISEVQRDPQGRFLFLKGTLHHRPITIVNVYAPNTQQVTFFRKTFRQLLTFQSGTLIVGGDFNVALNPSLDTSNGLSSLTYSAHRAIKSQFSANMILGAHCIPKIKTSPFSPRHITSTPDLITSSYPKMT